MEAIRIREVIRKKGELHVVGLPLKEGQSVEMILLVEEQSLAKPKSGAVALLQTGIVGLWEDHEIQNAQEYARQLRTKAQTRSRAA